MDRKQRGKWLDSCVEDAVTQLEYELNQGHTDGFLAVLDFYHRLNRYSPTNCMLIKIQKPNASHCAGFRAWEKMGHRVKQGEKAIYVRGPMIRKITDQDTGEITERLTGYIALPVFDVSQLEGEVTLPSPRHDLEGDYAFLYLNARAAIGGTGIVVVEEPLPTNVHGMSYGGRIVINPAISEAEKFLCLLHEQVHEVLHKRDSRDGTTLEQRELEAEAGSYLLAKLYGLENPFSRDYIINYGGGVQELHDSLTRIHQAVKQIAEMLAIEPRETQVDAAA